MANHIRTPTPTNYESNQDEWELVNDNGFIYKRKKRRLDPTAFGPSSDPVSDPAVELEARRYRKRKALRQLKDKYQKEIGLWEHLSETLKAMEHRKRMEAGEREKGLKEHETGDLELDSVAASQPRSMFSEVFWQVEAHEAIICDFQHLCEVAESLCTLHEEKTKQKFIDLPVWKSPCELMASLCEG